MLYTTGSLSLAGSLGKPILWATTSASYPCGVMHISIRFNGAGTAHACVKTLKFKLPWFPATDAEIRQHLIFIILLEPPTLDLSFQRFYVSKHFLLSDCLITSFYAVSTLSFDSAKIEILRDVIKND